MCPGDICGLVVYWLAHGALRVFAGAKWNRMHALRANRSFQFSLPSAPPGMKDKGRLMHGPDGRSPDSRLTAFLTLPGKRMPVVHSGSLTAYSCGGSHGIGVIRNPVMQQNPVMQNRAMHAAPCSLFIPEIPKLTAGAGNHQLRVSIGMQGVRQELTEHG